MGHDYSASKKIALRTIILLGVITVIEVIIALLGKGYLISGFELPVLLMGLAMIGLSLFKAYKIVFEFMHLGHEVRGLALSVVLPSVLLIWGIIAFLYEGSAWKGNRDTIEERNNLEEGDIKKQEGMLINDPETLFLF